MLTSPDDVLRVARLVYEAKPLPKPFALLDAAARVDAGADLAATAKNIATNRARLTRVLDAADRVADTFGVSLAAAAEERNHKRARGGLGQMLLGQLAERSFEEIYESTMHTSELILEDARGSRNDTDYRVLNGTRRPVFRINIKFHGTAFRNARDLVGLEPEDCFALATYKIHQGLRKQQDEALPYIFLVVSVLGLSGDKVADVVPPDLTHLAALALASEMSGKRDLEDAIVERLASPTAPREMAEAVAAIYPTIRNATWRVLSARRADRLLHERLFERVYALRVRAFSRNYRNAELDMHFSLGSDMATLDAFLKDIQTRGLPGVSVLLERGDL